MDTLRDYIVSFIGEYTPTLSPDGEVLGGLYSIDFTWIFAAVCFCIMLVGVLCILRTMIRGLFS